MPVIGDSERIFNWAEATYSQYFSPKGGPIQEQAGYSYRYYPYTNAYLATKDGKVYVLSPFFGTGPFVAGNIQDFIGMAMSAGY